MRKFFYSLFIIICLIIISCSKSEDSSKQWSKEDYDREGFLDPNEYHTQSELDEFNKETKRMSETGEWK